MGVSRNPDIHLSCNGYTRADGSIGHGTHCAVHGDSCPFCGELIVGHTQAACEIKMGKWQPQGFVSPPALDTTNVLLWSTGTNLPNHSATRRGLARFVAPATMRLPDALQFRTKDDAFRAAAWLVVLADSFLPDANVAFPHTFAEYLEAVQNT